MTILRDISFLWSMFHLIVLFMMLFEPRWTWRTTLIAGFAGSAALGGIRSASRLTARLLYAEAGGSTSAAREVFFVRRMS